MPATIDISELRIGYVLGAPIFDDKNVKLLGEGVTIAEKLISQLRRRGIRSVQVTEEDLAKLRGWKLSVDTPTQPRTSSASPSEPVDAKIDPGRFRRYLATIAEVGRQNRTDLGPLKKIRASAQNAAKALQSEHFGFGLNFPDSNDISFFVGSRRAGQDDEKLKRFQLKTTDGRSLMAAAQVNDAPLIVEDLAAEKRIEDSILADLKIESAVVVPLYRGMIRGGALAVFYKQPKQLDDHDLSFLETVANIVTVPEAIEPGELAAESIEVDSLTSHRVYDYRCWQSIAPMDEDENPLRSSYQEVLCRDISMSGFSFYYPKRPDFTQLAVALGKPPHLKQMKATVVSCSGADVEGKPCALVGCRFTGTL